MILHSETADSGKRLDAFLHGGLPEFSRSRLQSWIKSGRVLVNGQATRPSYILRGGESISVSPAELPPLKAEPEDLPLEVVYGDADVIVVNKPAGMVVHAGAGHHHGTLVNAVLHRFGPLSSINGAWRPGIVHRLDRDTSGLMVIARTDQAHQALARQFQDREIEKIYLALVHGRMKQPQGRITTPISRDPARRTRMTAKLATGRAAWTEYKVLEQFDSCWPPGQPSLSRFSFLEVRIRTGRTHQIRAHLASLHHPIVGDRLYGAPSAPPGLPPLSRFFLHAHRLGFRLPSTGDPARFEAPLPQELFQILDALRQNTARIK